MMAAKDDRIVAEPLADPRASEGSEAAERNCPTTCRNSTPRALASEGQEQLPESCQLSLRRSQSSDRMPVSPHGLAAKKSCRAAASWLSETSAIARSSSAPYLRRACRAEVQGRALPAKLLGQPGFPHDLRLSHARLSQAPMPSLKFSQGLDSARLGSARASSQSSTRASTRKGSPSSFGVGSDLFALLGSARCSRRQESGYARHALRF